jgi:hypothetical protein
MIDWYTVAPVGTRQSGVVLDAMRTATAKWCDAWIGSHHSIKVDLASDSRFGDRLKVAKVFVDVAPLDHWATLLADGHGLPTPLLTEVARAAQHDFCAMVEQALETLAAPISAAYLPQQVRRGASVNASVTIAGQPLAQVLVTPNRALASQLPKEHIRLSPPADLLPFEVIIGEARVSLFDLVHLQADDVVVLSQTVTNPVTMTSTAAKLVGSLARTGSKKAVVITSAIEG